MSFAKRTLLYVGMALALTVALPIAASAQDPFRDVCTGDEATAEAGNSVACQASKNPANDPVSTTIANVIQILIMVIGFAAVVVIIVSGFRYITSSGNPETTNSAKNAILFALIGVVIALFAQAIVTFVLRRL